MTKYDEQDVGPVKRINSNSLEHVFEAPMAAKIKLKVEFWSRLKFKKRKNRGYVQKTKAMNKITVKPI